MTGTLSGSLKDPESARFRWAKIPKNPDPDGTVHYCATVNAKNSYGGYIGFQPFIAVATVANGRVTDARIGAIASATAGEDRIIVDLCAKHGLNPYSAV